MAASAAADFLKSTNNLFDLHKTLRIIKAVVIYDGLDFLQCFIALSFNNLR